MVRICSRPRDSCNDNPRLVICETRFPNRAAACVCGSLRALGLTLVFNKHLCLQRLIYSSITPCSNHLRIPKMVIEVKRIHTDNFADARGNVRQPRLTEPSFDFTTCLFLTLSSVIVDILFFRLISVPHRVPRCSEL